MNIGFIGLGIMGAPVTAWPMGKNRPLGAHWSGWQISGWGNCQRLRVDGRSQGRAHKPLKNKPANAESATSYGSSGT